MSHRYFSETRITDDAALLSGAEAHHLLHVMRAAVGDSITLFDGSGFEFDASVARIARSEVQLTISTRREVDREASRNLTLAVALPKGDRQKLLVEKAVELGVARLVPLVSQRSVVKLKPAAIERLRRSVIEASKQCGRNRLMEISPPCSWEEVLTEFENLDARYVAHPNNATNLNSLQSTDASTDIIAAIGPEGGFTDEEMQAATNAGWQAIALGQRILRIETAALKLAALFLSD